MDNKADGEKSRTSVFKKIYARHKRQGKNPNRIDDVLHAGEDGSGVIDVTRIRNRVRNRSQMTCLDFPQSESEADISDGNADSFVSKLPGNSIGKGSELAFGQDLVNITESVLPIVSSNKNLIGKKCSCYSFPEFPGVYLYPKALDKELQTLLAYQAVTEYCELGPTRTAADNSSEGSNSFGSHRTNIDLLPPKAHEQVNQIDNLNETMWNLWKQDHNISANGPPPEKKRKNNKPANNSTNHYYRRFSKLSWATMGYHYDWTERSYNPQLQSRMPDLVAAVSTIFATANPIESPVSNTKFTPSASIVNYYTTKSTMGGHRDDLEDDDAMDKPIVSISLGLPGIFVLGGPIKDDASHPVRTLLLRPGDVLVMGGASRLNYHAMARVLPYEAALEYDQRIGLERMAGFDDLSENHFANLSVDDLSSSTCKIIPSKEREYLAEYLRNHRVNINVRQVYPDGA